MHGTQTGWSLGPFLLLIFVSLVLCSVRLYTRSLAASTLVHACYNFMLFSFMLLGTGGPSSTSTKCDKRALEISII